MGQPLSLPQPPCPPRPLRVPGWGRGDGGWCHRVPGGDIPPCPQRKPTCLACYKFDTSDVPKVLDKYHNCGPRHQLAVKVRCPQCPPGVPRVPARCQPLLCPQEIRQRDEAECQAVERAGKGGDIMYLPGMFAFSRGLPA